MHKAFKHLIGMCQTKKRGSDITGHLASMGGTNHVASGDGIMAGSAGPDSGRLF